MIIIPIEAPGKYIRIRQRSPGKYTKFRTGWLSRSQGIKAIWSIISPGKSEIQSYLFLKSKWTLDRAKAWVARHGGKPSGV